jgi:hypothetical protein
MSIFSKVCRFLGVAMLAAWPVVAHHAFEAEYDPQVTRDLQGVITKVEWVNPHAHLFINVEDEGGAVTSWSIELGPPYALERGGWTRSTVDIGDSITMQNVSLARDGRPKAGATRQSALLLADGTRMVLR